ncbi:hypothetical protein OS31_38710 [Dickeya oryzae]
MQPMPCAVTPLSVKKELGDALHNPAFVAELTGLINQGYWFFDDDVADDD